jgi:hypothetical protein
MDDSAKTDGQVAGEVMQPTIAERKEALIHSFEHAAKHNAPVTPEMLNELRAVVQEGMPALDDASKLGSG